MGLFLILLHSERPKLCTILAFLGTIGLNKEQILPSGVDPCCEVSLGGKNENSYIFLPESVSITLNVKLLADQ